MKSTTTADTPITLPPVKEKKYFSNRYMYIFSFNFLVGFGFLVSLTGVYESVGNFFFIVAIVCALIAYIVGLAYARLTTIFSSYGSVYNYTRPIFGKFTSYIFGWANFFLNPVTLLAAVMGVIWAFNSTKTLFGINLFENYKIIIAVSVVGLFLFLSFISNFGLTPSKVTLNILMIMKWIVLGGSIFMAFILLIKSGVASPSGLWNNILGGDIYNKDSAHYHAKLSVSAFVVSIMNFFFAFGGIEGIASISDDVKEPEKNMPRIITRTMIAVTIFYLVVFYLLISALGGSTTSKNGTDHYGLLPYYLPDGQQAAPNNPINSIMGVFFHDWIGITAGVGLLIIGIIVVIAQTANKLTSCIMNTWVAARNVVPMAETNELPYEFSKTNKYGQYGKACWFTTIITFAILIAYLIVFLVDQNSQNSLADGLAVNVLFEFFQYIGVLLAIIVYARNGKLKIHILETIMYGVTCAIIIALLIAYIFYGVKDGSLWFQLGFFFGGLGIGLALYAIGYLTKWGNKNYQAWNKVNAHSAKVKKTVS